LNFVKKGGEAGFFTMINMTTLLTDRKHYGDRLRYARGPRREGGGVAPRGHGPVVVWNSTRACNLDCSHCYADADVQPAENELSTAEAERVIDDLAQFKVPVLLFSGGEPFTRGDILHLAKYAGDRGIRPVISTNGTLITEKVALDAKEAGVKYIGISLDGLAERNDCFRGRKGAFEKTMTGIANCFAVGQRVGLRFTVSRYTYADLEAIFDLVEREKIPRVCFYHLVYAGRGASLKDEDITPEQKRKALDLIIAKTLEFNEKGLNTEILTVDNHADGIYLYLQEKMRNPERAATILQLLRRNGGNRSGVGFGNIDWRGEVHPDQFTQKISLGNVREHAFSRIWSDLSQPIMKGLKTDRSSFLRGRCGNCVWLSVCNGNLRGRALNETNDFWASDPGCYLTDEEIGVGTVRQ